jgi:hypothetical protein
MLRCSIPKAAIGDYRSDRGEKKAVPRKAGAKSNEYQRGLLFALQ